LTISSEGWQLGDPTGGGLLLDVGYRSKRAPQLRPTIERPPVGNRDSGGFCSDTDPLSTWSDFVSGTSLMLHPDGGDPCGDRDAVLQGTWKRVGS